MVLPASMRLRGHRCFNRLHRSSKRQHGTLMVLRVAAGDSNLLRRELRGIQERTCRCALVISNKVVLDRAALEVTRGSLNVSFTFLRLSVSVTHRSHIRPGVQYTDSSETTV